VTDTEESNPTGQTGDETTGDNGSRRSFAIVALTMIAIAVILAELIPAISNWEIRVSDLWLKLSRPATPNPQLIYLEIDKVSYAAGIPDSALAEAEANDLPVMLALQGEFPWNREVWARLAEKLMAAGARGVIFNFTFASEKPEDPYFQSVISNNAPNVVVGGLIEQEAGLITLVQPSPSIVETDHLGANMHNPSVGVLNIHTDADGIVRHGLYRMDYQNLARQALGSSMVEELGIQPLEMHSLAARTADLTGKSDQIPEVSERPMIRFTGPAGTFPVVSLGQVMHPGKWQSEFKTGEYFRDKLIVVGPGAGVFENSHTTPVGTMSATEIHLSYINAILDDGFIRPSGRLINILVVCISGVLGVLISMFIRSSVAQLVMGFVLCGGLAALHVSLAGQAGFLVQSFLVPVLLINSLTILRQKFQFSPGQTPTPSN